MTAETGMSLVVVGRKRQTGQTAHDRMFQKMEAATGNERRRDVQPQRERPLQTATPGRLDTGTSWLRYGGAIPL